MLWLKKFGCVLSASDTKCENSSVTLPFLKKKNADHSTTGGPAWLKEGGCHRELRPWGCTRPLTSPAGRHSRPTPSRASGRSSNSCRRWTCSPHTGAWCWGRWRASSSVYSSAPGTSGAWRGCYTCCTSHPASASSRWGPEGRGGEGVGREERQQSAQGLPPQAPHPGPLSTAESNHVGSSCKTVQLQEVQWPDILSKRGTLMVG